MYRQWFPRSVRKDIGAVLRDFCLSLQRIEDRLGHLYLSRRTVSLGRRLLACHKGFANKNLSPLEVDVLPLEAMNLTGTHAGKEPDNEIIPCSPRERDQ